MSSNRKNLTVFSAVFLLFSFPAGFYLGQYGWDDDSLDATLRISARLALLIYLLIFIARPLRELRVNMLGRQLVKNRRLMGIAFAAIMTAHLVLLIARNGLPAEFFGMLIYALIYLMLITSFNKPAAVLGPRRWRILHKTGLYAIGIALAQAQFTRILRGVGEPVHYVLGALVVIAIGVRVAAWLKKRQVQERTQRAI